MIRSFTVGGWQKYVHCTMRVFQDKNSHHMAYHIFNFIICRDDNKTYFFTIWII